MTALSINLNKIALLRNSREGNYPNPLDYAQICVGAGCHGITVHPRPDQRHIRPRDVKELSAFCQGLPDIEFNIEGNPFAGHSKNQRGDDYPGFMPLVEQHRPDQATLVPDGDEQLTSDHGFNLKADAERIQPVIKQLQDWGIRVSLFMDPDPEQIRLAAQVGADRIELYTGPYAEQFDPENADFKQLHAQYLAAAATAQEVGLGVNAGHDLNLINLPTFVQIPNILEVSIGHAFTADSLKMGMENCTRAYLAALEQP